MNPFVRLLERWRPKGHGEPRRRILLEIVGLELAAIDRYLDEGLLHNLALLIDVGGRSLLASSIAAQFESVRQEARRRGIRIVELAPPSKGESVDLSAICQSDELQQTRLIEQLSHRPRNELVICTFDMPARLSRLFGENPSEPEQLVLRDVYVRMDEVVGKVYSFVSDSVAFSVAVGPDLDCHRKCDAPPVAALFHSLGPISMHASPIELCAALFFRAHRVSE